MSRWKNVSFLFLIVLGLNVLGDLFVSTETHESANFMSSSIFNSETTHNDCQSSEDGCHLRQCHFGHCAHVRLDSVSSIFSDDLVGEKSLAFIKKHESPYLEGLKRPPISVS